MFCENCGKELEKNWRICPGCGKPICNPHTSMQLQPLIFKKIWFWGIIAVVLGGAIITLAVLMLRKEAKMTTINGDKAKEEAKTTSVEAKKVSGIIDFSEQDFEALIGENESQLEEIGLKQIEDTNVYTGLNGNIRIVCKNGKVEKMQIQRDEKATPLFHSVKIGMNQETAKEILKNAYPKEESITNGFRLLNLDMKEYIECRTENNAVTSIKFDTLSETRISEQEIPEEIIDKKDVNAEYIFPNSDKRYLSEDEVKGKSANELLIGRNEVFARHGYIFEMEELQKHFENTSWYHGTVPSSQFNMDAIFNEFEKKNVELIKRIENGDASSLSREYENQTPTNEPPQILDFNLNVINNTGIDIYCLYASETNTDDWEEDILGEDILYAGESSYIIFTMDADSLKWDFAIQDEYEEQTEFYDLSFADCNVEGATLVLWREGGEIRASLY